MLPVKINQSNISLLNLHTDKIEGLLRIKLNDKIGTFTINSFEHNALNWLEGNLSLILNSTTDKLRTIIRDFNIFIESTITGISWNQNNYQIATNEQLKQVCRDNNLSGFSNKNKNELIALIIHGSITDYITINQIKFKEFKKQIADVFEIFYEKKWDDIEGYNRYVFVKEHKINTCPYCNRGYIFIVKSDSAIGKLRPEIDHFFPKSIYPYLAMSFYNLIPSCSICNHTKKSKDPYLDNLLSPYEIDYSTFKFTYNLKNLNFYQIKERKFNINLDSFDIQLNGLNIEYMNKYFKLDLLYEQHKDVVLEILIKRTEYPKSYIENLKKDFKFTDDEIYRFLLCNYKKNEDLHKRPLSKLTKDIAEELKLI